MNDRAQTGDRPVAAIVDGYSTGNFLPAAFDRHGADVVHVQSTPEWMTSMLLPDLNQYTGNIVYDDHDKTLRRIRESGAVAVLAGQEPGVPLADLLSKDLGVASNGTTYSAAKRDKFHMIEAIRDAGLHCADQLRSGSVDEIVGWARERDEFPVVVKPLSSASTDGVTICHDVDEVRDAAEAVLAAEDIFDIRNREVLVQSYLDGVEYIVDTVSSHGERFVVGVWRYDKNLVNGKNLYDRDVLIPADEEPVAELIAYTDKVLDALNIRHGPTHTEVKMTSSGPALVEIGARLNGNMNPDFHNVCLGHNQADLMALAYLDPQRFAREYGGRNYQVRRPAIVYNAPSEASGEVEEVDAAAVKRIEELPSVFLMSVKVKPGGRVKRTVDLLTSPLRIFMTGESMADIDRDYHRIQEWKDEVYRLSC
ncbi:ATP-grasp domain-containing protein [Haloglycomyces albus]|uniref:ATP-grasp domain-containing protein n=1 Tax=Haloglycomyces albus TaxID=526067 RepID=UPI00054F2998|nr:ATP-grasp domain-containing protein [Haloglycomyces albus]